MDSESRTLRLFGTLYLLIALQGLTLRIRERLVPPVRGHFIERITPAYAGKTSYSVHKRYLYWDHPRVCGKDDPRAIYVRVTLGSPPRMRERQEK